MVCISISYIADTRSSKDIGFGHSEIFKTTVENGAEIIHFIQHINITPERETVTWT